MREAVAYALSPRVLFRNAAIAAGIGSVLVAVNLSGRIRAEGWTAELLLRGAFNYVIPFVVSTVSAAANRPLLGAVLVLGLAGGGCAPSRPESTWDETRLIEALGGADDDARRRAAGLLGARRSVKALWPLTRALGDPRWEVRVAAVEALELLEDPRADKGILAAARDRHWWVQTTALKALARRRPLGAAQAAHHAAASDNDAVKAAAMRLADALGASGQAGL
ncbi:HEAT repeat domain-containing protein [bacterium]|nr:MAG: HEAT repeat domain-containing protein [bacterium]